MVSVCGSGIVGFLIVLLIYWGLCCSFTDSKRCGLFYNENELDFLEVFLLAAL